VLDELNLLIAAWETDGAQTPVVIRSAKAKGFCAGADLKRIASLSTTEKVDRFVSHGQQTFDRLASLARPTVAVINGPCLGGGLEFALACRHRVAIDADQQGGTRLGLPESTLGLIPAWGGTQRLPRLVGLATALDLMLSGESVNADEALQLGLVDEVLRGLDVDAELQAWVAKLLSSPPPAPLHPPFPDKEVYEVAEKRWLMPDQPARHAVLKAVRAGWRSDMQAGLAMERTEFCQLVFSPQARQCLGAMFAGKPR
jgi:3-hydroxyacyl-CoA dehydrogenase/enoyl-CoA hydratase/3-hydroxybutyryl-CoA epimerase